MSTKDRPLVLLATTKVDEQGIWRNGLFQNVLLFIELLRNSGFAVEQFVNNPDEHKDSALASRFPVFDLNRLADPKLRICAFLEIGMNCPDPVRTHFRSHGAKVVKLYLGNILNIDIEISTFQTTLEFCHHIPGRVDATWVSPHYYLDNGEYARVINHQTAPVSIAPYVWDPQFIMAAGATRSSFMGTAPYNFTVMEPNISFQKSSFISLMVIEAFYRAHPTQTGRVLVVNGDKLAGNPYFMGTIAPRLTLIRDKLVDFSGRRNTTDVMRDFSGSIIVSHQITNEYNYMMLEFMHMGFPYVHNCDSMTAAGYYYKGNGIAGGVAAIERAIAQHAVTRDGDYAAAAQEVIWRFSVKNPANTEAWRKLLMDLHKK